MTVTVRLIGSYEEVMEVRARIDGMRHGSMKWKRPSKDGMGRGIVLVGMWTWADSEESPMGVI